MRPRLKIALALLVELSAAAATFFVAGSTDALALLSGHGKAQASRHAVPGKARLERIASVLRGSSTTLDVDRRDFDLLSRDARAAMAAYPGVARDALLVPVAVAIPFEARVPSDWSAGPAETRVGEDGRRYVDGVAYVTVVRPGYSLRAGADVVP